MSNVIEVYPQDGSWYWRKADTESEPFETRGQAFEDALVERDEEAIVLLREDGSVHGELYHAGSPSGAGQRVDILAGQTRDNPGDSE